MEGIKRGLFVALGVNHSPSAFVRAIFAAAEANRIILPIIFKQADHPIIRSKQLHAFSKILCLNFRVMTVFPRICPGSASAHPEFAIFIGRFIGLGRPALRFIAANGGISPFCDNDRTVGQCRDLIDGRRPIIRCTRMMGAELIITP